ncbi:hypothetical protein EUTSA_v10005408mg [Eutrema salsugineum]|uniref:Pentatricopeptide repeat-containing protein n=1 Tax=Eutrema salsugineum TaxID=72664 RepID=V4KKM3_EUTSA|nr:hypothetical protein EUTSA_v10005408mg [Eutrema salsugineum]
MRTLETSATFLCGHFSRRIFTIPTATLNRMINDHLREDGLVEARKLFDQNRTSLDNSTWNMMITAYCFIAMRRSGLNPDELTLPPIMDAVLGSAFKVSVLQIHTLAIRLGLSLSPYTGSALIFCSRMWYVLIMGYMKLGFVEDGERAFGEIPDRNIITWHAMLIVYINNSKIDKARELFNRMSQKNVF